MTTLSEPREVRYLGADWDAEAHIEDVVNPERIYTGLCGLGLNQRNRLVAPRGRSLCRLCGEIADDEFYDRAEIRRFYPSYNGIGWTGNEQPAAVAL
ncbi:hypothetical protein [Nonomuraea sp. SYSU D8015]|uniref:hypothetical protein n=1 Tax=Nonomuraea sp. SYSU D8015 TaxID=2593644 RepID=UPI00166035CF|nr:hypothetical protein [Nonomuraea sp. SYSU D8015]